MQKRILFGLFFLIMSAILILSSLDNAEISYAYPTDNTSTIRIYYQNEQDNDLVEEKAKSSFQLIDSNNEVIRAFETFIGDDYVELNGIKPGEYSIRQVIAPNDYNTQEVEVINVIKNEEVQNFYLEATKSEEIKLALALVDIKTNRMVVGSEFHLLNKDGDIVDTCTTSTGFCYLKGLKEETYILENVESADGYTMLEKEEITIVNENIHTKYLTLYTEGIKVIINVCDKKNNQVISNYNFSIVDNLENIVYTFKDNIIENIKSGDYKLIENKTPEGYKPLNSPIPFTVEDTTEEQLINIYYERDDLKQNNSFYIFLAGIFSLLLGISYLFTNKNCKKVKTKKGETNAK